MSMRACKATRESLITLQQISVCIHRNTLFLDCTFLSKGFHFTSKENFLFVNHFHYYFAKFLRRLKATLFSGKYSIIPNLRLNYLYAFAMFSGEMPLHCYQNAQEIVVPEDTHRRNRLLKSYRILLVS
ncbi:hypothetical protein KP509_04G017700 [Ceratopteris richardii]|uniref:Uncharacterized protein n=1 Tax=Ceratopteris richardii TaxID=49495 RepID=A0A8T2UXQ5_CERRI|nr:hypothetical protein KP509_04G017700 [Ceratopteris richardii]